MKLTTQVIDWLNIAFMIASAVAAYFLPFEVFLFAYAVLGPLHYLTEISWLHERRYFASGKYDYLWLLALTIALFVSVFLVPWREMARGQETGRFVAAGIGYLAFLSALAMTVFRRPQAKFACVACGLVLLFAVAQWPAYTIIFAIFLPTLIHVYVFTGLFILYGALKSRSRPGLLSLGVFLACPILLMFVHTDTGYAPSEYARQTYPLFAELNATIYRLLGFPARDQAQFQDALYRSAVGLAIMRCIAFAYTYHYLNWFLKTSIIGWHRVSMRRLSVIGGLWLAAVGVYVYDYRIGFITLATLSFLHVFLEFPLNHRSIIGIATELRNRWRLEPESLAMAPAMPKRVSQHSAS
jgi:hypothetical protein